jgi:PncC family amidohydrolase
MARGARERLHVELAVATTGVAGPGGGSATKPVGLTYVAIQGSAIDACARFEFAGDRAANVEAATREALVLLANALSTAKD